MMVMIVNGQLQGPETGPAGGATEICMRPWKHALKPTVGILIIANRMGPYSKHSYSIMCLNTLEIVLSFIPKMAITSYTSKIPQHDVLVIVSANMHYVPKEGPT